MPGWCGGIGLAVFVTAVVGAAVATSAGVVAEPVRLPLPDGRAVCGTLYRPQAELRKQLPAVVLVHGTAVARRSCAPGLALPLARSGSLALAIDLPGHGDSGGSLPRGELDAPWAGPGGPGEHPEIEAALDFLKAHPLFVRRHVVAVQQAGGGKVGYPITRLGIVGHSLGGWAAANVAYRRADVDSVVSIGACPAACDPTRPRNLLVLTGKWDELFPAAGCAEAILRASGGAVREPGPRCGTFWAGTARRLMSVNNVNHLTVVANPSVTRAVIQWVSASFDIRAGEEPGRPLVGLAALVLLATGGGLVASGWALARLADLGLGRPTTTPRPRHFPRLVAFFGLLGLGMAAVARAAGPLDVGPVLLAGPCLALAALLALSALAAAAGSGGSSEAGPQRGAYRRGLALGGAALVLGFGWLGLPWGLTWLDLWPTPRRFALALALLPLLFPCCLGLALGLGRWAGGGVRGLAWAALPVALWLGYSMLPAGGHPLFLVPVALTAAGCLVPLPLWLLPGRPGLGLARALSHAGASAWLLACHLPFVHTG